MATRVTHTIHRSAQHINSDRSSSPGSGTRPSGRSCRYWVHVRKDQWGLSYMPVRFPRSLVVLIFVTVISIGAAVTVTASEPLAWRARVVLAKLSGELPEIPLADLGRWLTPGTAVYLGALADSPNVHSGVRNLLSDDESAERGAQVFGGLCAHCHGDNARGGAGPNLIASVANTTDWAFFSAVKWGRGGTAMAAQPISDLGITQRLCRHRSTG